MSLSSRKRGNTLDCSKIDLTDIDGAFDLDFYTVDERARLSILLQA